jgi:hypothetical protein
MGRKIDIGKGDMFSMISTYPKYPSAGDLEQS